MLKSQKSQMRTGANERLLLALLLGVSLVAGFQPLFRSIGLNRLNALARRPSGTYREKPKPEPEAAAFEQDAEEEDVNPNPKEPTWLEMFPPMRPGSVRESEIERDVPDWASLKPDDPLFLDMPWPTEAGPDATAFARHMQWRRRLTDGERVRWQKWAVYSRLLSTTERYGHHFQYSASDYVLQNMQRELQQKALANAAKGYLLEASAWETIAYGFAEKEMEEVGAVIKGYYSAINRRNFDEVKALLLPDEETSCVLPGYEQATGYSEVESLLKRVIKEAKPFGSIAVSPIAIYAVGYTAIAQVFETIEPGTALKTVKRNGKSKPTKAPVKRVCSTLVLRKFNKQWRVWGVHSVKVGRASLLGDQVPAPRMIKPRQSRSSAASERSKTDRSSASGRALSKAIKAILSSKNYGYYDSEDGEDGEDDDSDLRRKFSRATSGSSSDSEARQMHRSILDSDVVDSDAPSIKQAVQALRLLHFRGELTADQRDILVRDTVLSVAAEKVPMLEVAYELLLMEPMPETEAGDRQGLGMMGWDSSADLRKAVSEGALQSESQYRTMLTELLTGAYGDRGRPPGPKQRQKISAAVDATSAEITAHRQKFKKEMSDLTFSIIKSQRGKSGGKERAMREFERKAAKLIKVASGREQEIILKHFPNFAGNSRPQELLRTEPRRGLLEGDVEQRLAEFREQCLLILGFEDGADSKSEGEGPIGPSDMGFGHKGPSFTIEDDEQEQEREESARRKALLSGGLDL